MHGLSVFIRTGKKMHIRRDKERTVCGMKIKYNSLGMMTTDLMGEKHPDYCCKKCNKWKKSHG